MELNKIYQSKHELWLKILYSSFSIKNERIKSQIYNFANIEFRHMKWLSNNMKEQDISYDYEKYAIDMPKSTVFEVLEYIISEIKLCMKEYNPEEPLFARILSDEYYFITAIELLLQDRSNDDQITVYNKKREYEDKNLDDLSRDALTLFLFEESYKEYELILLYSYFQNYTTDILQYNIYQDMIDESQFHLKSFGEMMAKMGVLAIPRTVIPTLYQNKNIKQFLIDGIDEEIKAKEECAALADAIDDDEISSFLTFIMYQENYHIELMQKAIKQLEVK
ncbi:MAG: iron-binding protein [Campylobacterota bacterium]|nr:iron-binding protein [Campylobacterota bacterium]